MTCFAECFKSGHFCMSVFKFCALLTPAYSYCLKLILIIDFGDFHFRELYEVVLKKLASVRKGLNISEAVAVHLIRS